MLLVLVHQLVLEHSIHEVQLTLVVQVKQQIDSQLCLELQQQKGVTYLVFKQVQSFIT